MRSKLRACVIMAARARLSIAVSLVAWFSFFVLQALEACDSTLLRGESVMRYGSNLNQYASSTQALRRYLCMIGPETSAAIANIDAKVVTPGVWPGEEIDLIFSTSDSPRVSTLWSEG